MRWRYVLYESLSIQTGWSRTYQTQWPIISFNALLSFELCAGVLMQFFNKIKKNSARARQRQRPDLKWPFFCNVQLLSIYWMNQNLSISKCCTASSRWNKNGSIVCVLNGSLSKISTLFRYSIQILQKLWTKHKQREQKPVMCAQSEQSYYIPFFAAIPFRLFALLVFQLQTRPSFRNY